MQPNAVDFSSLRRFAWLSVAAAIATIALKSLAWGLTGSVGLLSDALESLVNLAGALLAVAMLTIASRPADEDHPYGHGKAEYFSSGMEGGLIVVAALGIGVAAVQRLLVPRPLDRIGLGVAISVVASVVNLAVARALLRAGRRHGSITLEANAHHLMTDVWTSAGVIGGVGAVAISGWLWLDPLVALAVAGNIVRTGAGVVRRSIAGLMDESLPEAEVDAIRRALDRHLEEGMQHHALRTRRSGTRRFVSAHVLVPGDWTVHRGHQLLEEIEADIREALPGVTVTFHLESLDDPASWEDMHLDRT